MRWAVAVLLLLVLLVAVPVAGIETLCRAPPVPEQPFASALDPALRRPEARSYLSYPEWYIVHAYEDFAGVLRQADESRFDYPASIKGFWTSFCGVNRLTSAHGGSDLESKVMLYVIGLSFTAEMAVKGLYETTLGRIALWVRGAERTPEDRFALRLQEDYARFLQQTPWYAYPFGAELVRFWRETPFGEVSRVRSAERRLALSAEWGFKAGYAKLLGAMAGLAPAELSNRSVVLGVDAGDAAADVRIRVVRDLGQGRSEIETPRYRAFTEVVRGLGSRGRRFVEIAGNDDVLVTALVPDGADPAVAGGRAIFAFPIQSRPGWRRVGLDLRVERLSEAATALASRGAEFEHVYDY